MAYIEVDIEIDEYLSEADTACMVEELQDRYDMAVKRGDKKTMNIIEQLKISGNEDSLVPGNLGDLDKIQLFKSYIDILGYDKIKTALENSK